MKATIKTGKVNEGCVLDDNTFIHIKTDNYSYYCESKSGADLVTIKKTVPELLEQLEDKNREIKGLEAAIKYGDTTIKQLEQENTKLRNDIRGARKGNI